MYQLFYNCRPIKHLEVFFILILSFGYYVSFNIEFEKEIDLELSIDTFDISKSIGIDLNGYNIAISQPINNTHLIDNGANSRKVIQNSRIIKILQRKQSRRVKKGKIGKNFKKTQKKFHSYIFMEEAICNTAVYGLQLSFLKRDGPYHLSSLKEQR